MVDLDGDGDPDVVTVNLPNAFQPGGASVLRGNGDGTLHAAVSYPMGNRPTAVAVADVNGDAVADLVAAEENIIAVGGISQFGDGKVRVLLGNGDATFEARVVLPVGDADPVSIAVADLDGDSVPDLITANLGGRSPSDGPGDVSLLFGNGDRSFEVAISLPAGIGPTAVAVADFDGDTVADLAVANGPRIGPDGISVLLGNGDGTFQTAAFFTAGAAPVSIAAADLDNDSFPDLVTANSLSSDVSVLLGNGDGTFQAAAFFSVGRSPRSIAVADLDGDGAPDLVTANRGSDDVSVLLGNGDGTFQAAAFFSVSGQPSSIAVADLDDDTFPDLVTSNGSNPFGGSNGVSVLLGNGDGTFGATTLFPAGGRPTSIAVADFDRDAIPDVVVTIAGSSDASVLLGNGDGSFQAPVAFAAGDLPFAVAVAVADLDGDTLPDVVTAHGRYEYVSVLFHLREELARPEIDIKPGSDSNSINPSSKGVLPVALLGSDSFDVADVDVMTLAFGPDGAAFVHSYGPHFGDLNGDGFTDLLAHFRIAETGIAFGDMEACVTSETLDGTPFKSCDAVRTVPDKNGMRSSIKRRQPLEPAP